MLSKTIYSFGGLMREVAFTVFAMLLGVAFVSCSSEGSGKLSDREAAEVLQTAWKDESVRLYLGPLQFTTDDSVSPGFTGGSTYPLYRAFAKQGLITLDDLRFHPGFLQGRVPMSALVALTPEGTKTGNLDKSGAGESQMRWVQFLVGTYEIERIVTNEAIDMNAEKYRVVQGLHSFKLNPGIGEAPREAGLSTYPERRFRALLKYDSINLKWKLQTADVGPRDIDFQSENVPTTLAKLRARGSS